MDSAQPLTIDVRRETLLAGRKGLVVGIAALHALRLLRGNAAIAPFRTVPSP